jgi:hypothetical protein
MYRRSTWWCIWLRYWATSRKVAGSIPDGVIGIFYWHNPSGLTMAPGLTQPLTEMSTRNVSLGERRPVCRADKLTTFMCWLSWNLGASTSWNPQGLSRPIKGFLYLFTTRTYSLILLYQCKFSSISACATPCAHISPTITVQYFSQQFVLKQ